VIPLTPAATAASAALRNGLGNAGPNLLRRTGLALGAVIGGGILAAIHQLVAEEGRTLIRHAIGDLARRRRQNERVLLAILGTDLPLEHQEAIRTARDSWRAAIAILGLPELDAAHREMLRKLLVEIAAS
jgi:hypothetical protein